MTAHALDDHFIYVFVRQDIPLAAQLVHSCHATFHMAPLYASYIGAARGEDCWAGIPTIVLIGVPDARALDRVREKLRVHSISSFFWCDPDTDLGVTAIATVPISHAHKDALKNYRLWAHRDPVSIQSLSGDYSPGAPLTTDGAGFNAGRGANADVAQLREHSVSNRGVEGANPSVGSISDAGDP